MIYKYVFAACRGFWLPKEERQRDDREETSEGFSFIGTAAVAPGLPCMPPLIHSWMLRSCYQSEWASGTDDVIVQSGNGEDLNGSCQLSLTLATQQRPHFEVLQRRPLASADLRPPGQAHRYDIVSALGGRRLCGTRWPNNGWNAGEQQPKVKSACYMYG
jgi:hypothetical protein